MRKRSRIAEELLEQLESVGLQLIVRAGGDAHIRGQFGPRQLQALMDLLPKLKSHWRAVLTAAADRDENEVAAAMVRLVGEDANPAAILGRLGGLKGGHARARAMTKKERSESARRAALARWESKA